MSKILSGVQLEKFKERYFNEEGEEIFSIILSIEDDIVHCFINGDKKIDFKKEEVIEFL